MLIILIYTNLNMTSYPHKRGEQRKNKQEMTKLRRKGKGIQITYVTTFHGNYHSALQMTLANGNYEKIQFAPPCLRGLSHLGQPG